MAPRTRLLMPAVGLLLLSACGTPPEPLPTSPPLAGPSLRAPAGSAPAGAPPPPMPVTPPVTTPVRTYPTYTYQTPTTTRPTTASPAATTTRPAPSYAPRCTGEPTGAQIVTLAETSPAVPDQKPGQNVSVLDGPYCADGWSFTTIGMTGAEPLSVIATGAGTTLALVTVGTDVCNPTVKKRAPAGIRAMACGS